MRVVGRLIRAAAVVGAAAAVGAMTACGSLGEDDPARGSVTVDTVAGVPHVVSAGPGEWPEGGAREVDAESAVRIGEVDGEDPYVFGRVAGVTVGEDGRIYVGDTQALEVRVFSPGGEFLTRFGREGEGPGEFTNISGVGRAPEGIAVLDGRQARVTVFRPDGEVVRTIRLERRYMVFEYGALMRFDREGRFYDRARLSSAPMIDSAGVVVYSSKGEPVDTVQVAVIEQDHLVVERGGVPRMSFPRPFTARPSLTVGPDGRIYFARGGDYRVTVLSPEGDTIRVVRRPVEPRPVTAAERDSALEVVEGRYRDAAGEPPPGGVDLPDVKPVIADLEVDDRGYLWVMLQPDPGAPRVEWAVHDPEGRYLGSVDLPRMAVRQIGDDFVAGVETGELDVQRVVVYPLERR